MNREDIIRAMRSACDKDKVNAWKNNFWTITQEELERFAYLVAAKEREACAKVCEDNAVVPSTPSCRATPPLSEQGAMTPNA
jgi:hypothetical protein